VRVSGRTPLAEYSLRPLESDIDPLTIGQVLSRRDALMRGLMPGCALTRCGRRNYRPSISTVSPCGAVAPAPSRWCANRP